MRLNELGTCPDTEPPGYKPLVINKVVVGPFEEKEEGTGVASDVVKVEGEDPGTPGPLIQRMTPGPQRFHNIGSTKQSNTHTHVGHTTLYGGKVAGLIWIRFAAQALQFSFAK